MTTSPTLKLQRVRALVRNLYPRYTAVESVNNPVRLPNGGGEMPMTPRTVTDPDTGETVTVYVCLICDLAFYTDKEKQS